MAQYGTILIIYNSSVYNLQSVESILNENEIHFLTKENSFFFKTLSLRNRDKVAAQLKDKDLTFVLFHNNNSDGDRIKSGNMDNYDRRLIKKFIIEE